MKLLINPLYSTLLLLLMLCGACATKPYTDPASLSQMIQSNRFTFMAQRANPMDYSSVNAATANLPGAVYGRILDLDYGYTFSLSPEQLSVRLPYFGRAYAVAYGSRDTGFNIETKDYTLTKSFGKKQSVIYTIKPSGESSIQQMILEVFPTGRALLSVQSTDRQPISYDGYLTPIKTETPTTKQP